MSIRAWLAKRKIKAVFDHFDKVVEAAEDTEINKAKVFTRGLNALTKNLPDISKEKGVTVDPLLGAAFEGDTVTYRGARDDRAVLFLHGGGYIWGEARHFHDTAMRVSRLTGAPVLVPTYKLAPEHQYPSQLEEAVEAFDYLVKLGVEPNQIALMGDSAGGNLAFALAQHLASNRDEANQPGAMVLFSPWLDLTGDAVSVNLNAEHDVMLRPTGIKRSGSLFAGDIPLDDPRVSPLFGPMEGLPPTHIQASSKEILLDDSTRAAELLEDAGVPVDLVVWSGLWHDFQQSARAIPEARRALKQAANFILDCWEDA